MFTKAMVLPKFGGPELFEPRDVEKPKPGPGEIPVHVIAPRTNPVDVKIRASRHSAQLVLPGITGYDATGIVEEAGKGVTDFTIRFVDGIITPGYSSRMYRVLREH